MPLDVENPITLISKVDETCLLELNKINPFYANRLTYMTRYLQ